MVQSATVAKIMEKVIALQEQLDELACQKEETLQNEEGKDSPNEERVEKYQGQMDILQEASMSLTEAADKLEEYE